LDVSTQPANLAISLFSQVSALEVSSEDSVDLVKSQIQDAHGFLCEEQRLTFAGRVLEDNKCLASYNITPNATLELSVRLLGGIQIWIKTLTGRKMPFNVANDIKVYDVKHALQEKEGIQVDQIRLIFSGKQLSDDKTLEDYKVTAGSVIHMVLQLRGGAHK